MKVQEEDNFLRNWDVIHFLENFKVSNSLSERKLKQLFFEYNNSKNILVICELIDCLSRNHLVFKEIIEFVFDKIKGKEHYNIKLAALDFLLETKEILSSMHLEKEIHSVLHLGLKNKNYRIVTNQILMDLIYFGFEEKLNLKRLLLSIKNTTDYRSHIRIYNNLVDYRYESVANQDIEVLIQSSVKKDFGKSVIYTINKVLMKRGMI